MTLEIDCTDETESLDKNTVKQIIELLRLAAKLEKVEGNCELSLTFTDNARIMEINRDFRGINQPTDVISFALEESAGDELEIVGENIPRALGDIIISVPKAHEQAESYGHTFMREMGFLAVHGFLHLLGYDHQNKEEEVTMFQRQEEILQQYGLTR